MIEKTQNYINGAWIDAQSSEIIEVMNRQMTRSWELLLLALQKM